LTVIGVFAADQSWLLVNSCIKSQKTHHQGTENHRFIYQFPVLEQNVSVGCAVNTRRTVDTNSFMTRLIQNGLCRKVWWCPLKNQPKTTHFLSSTLHHHILQKIRCICHGLFF